MGVRIDMVVLYWSIISRRLIKCSERSRSEQSLVRWATPQLHDIDALAKMVDPAMKGMYPAKSLSRFADIIALCVQVYNTLTLPIDGIIRITLSISAFFR